MSRAINLSVSREQAEESCTKLGVGVSVIETLKSGGVRLVCNDSAGAMTIRSKLKKSVIDGAVTRAPIYPGNRHQY